MNRPSTSWLPLGSAHAIDWKHLGRPASARGATAWASAIDGETVLVRAWGEETTSYFDFVFLSDERVAGRMVVGCTRGEANRLRLKTELEVEGVLAFTDTVDFRENARTLLLTLAARSLEVDLGEVAEEDLPPIAASTAELFEIAPDSAMQTLCGDFIAGLLRKARDAVRADDSTFDAAAGAPEDEKPETPQPMRKEATPAPRARTEQAMRPPSPRSTMDGEAQPRRVVQPEAVKDRDRAVADAPNRERAPSRAAKLVCSTNSGESFEITGEETFIGRSKQCAIVLKSQRVSRKHACVTKEADGFYINDVGAANGIWAGSEKIDREKIENGDEFIIGDVVLSFTYAG